MVYDWPAQLGWNEWKSVWDGNSGGIGMQNQQQLYRPFHQTWDNTEHWQQYIPQPTQYQREMERLQQMIKYQHEDEEKTLLKQVHSTAMHYKLRLLQELALA